MPSSFNTINDILQLPVAGFAMGVGDINQPPLWNRGNADHDNTMHFYWQDDWRVKPRFSLNYGLAWTYESNALNYDLTKPEYLAPLYGAEQPGPRAAHAAQFQPHAGLCLDRGQRQQDRDPRRRRAFITTPSTWRSV